jgi:hypothetical protein
MTLPLDTAMKLSGLMKLVRYPPRLNEHQSMIDFCMQVHPNKLILFGLNWFSVETIH